MSGISLLLPEPRVCNHFLRALGTCLEDVQREGGIFMLGLRGGRCRSGDREVALCGLAVEVSWEHPADDLGMLAALSPSPCGTELHVEVYPWKIRIV